MRLMHATLVHSDRGIDQVAAKRPEPRRSTPSSSAGGKTAEPLRPRTELPRVCVFPPWGFCRQDPEDEDMPQSACTECETVQSMKGTSTGGRRTA